MLLEELLPVIGRNTSVTFNVPPDGTEHRKQLYRSGTYENATTYPPGSDINDYGKCEVKCIEDGDMEIRVYLKGWDKNFKRRIIQ